MEQIEMPCVPPTSSGFSTYIRREITVRARQAQDNEVVKCYNGERIASEGDYIVIDEQDRVMIVKCSKFKHHYMGVTGGHEVQESDDSLEGNAGNFLGGKCFKLPEQIFAYLRAGEEERLEVRDEVKRPRAVVSSNEA